MNDFISKPEVIIPKYPEICPASGLPKDYLKLMSQRQIISKQCEINSTLRPAEMKRCAKSILYWLNAWVYTESFFFVDANGVSRTRQDRDFPFMTWPKQDALILEIQRCIRESESVLVEKSREVGASWCVLMVFLHEFIFSPKAVQFSLLSLKESDVDNIAGDVINYPYGTISDPSTLLGKIDYAMRHFPKWMLPPMYRKRLQLVRTDTRSRIEGGASGLFALSSQRRNAVLLDEAAKTENFRTIWQGTTDVTRCRLAVSTPVGAGSFFSELRDSGTIPVMELGWWDDPAKASDLEVETLPDNHYRLTSSWYRNECARRTAVDIAQNLDIKHLESSQTFFPTMLLRKYKEQHAHAPIMRLRIDFRPEVPDAQIPGILATKDVAKVRVTVDPRGPWKLWFDPKGKPTFDPKTDELQFSPNSVGQVIFGIDISMGTGASNSCISVVDKLRRTKMAEFSDANVPPHQLAKLTCAAALWFGQTQRPLVVPEANGIPGFDFLRQLAKVYRYSNVYAEKSFLSKTDKQTPSLGFHSSRPKKATLLGNLSRAYSLDNWTNPSGESVNEAINYIIYESGAIGPAYLTAESEDAKATHGDRVIADALALWAGNESEAYREERRLAKDAGRVDVPKIDMKAKYPYGSIGWRMQHKKESYLNQPKRKLEDVKPGDRFNLRDFV